MTSQKGGAFSPAVVARGHETLTGRRLKKRKSKPNFWQKNSNDRNSQNASERCQLRF